MNALEGKALLDYGAVIARRYAPRIGADVAEELRGEAVVRALRSPPPDGRMEPWLERIYRNLLVDRWRRGHVRAVALAEVPELAGAGTPEDAVWRHERRRAVRRGLGRLPREARRALLSRYWGELDDRAAASRLGVNATTIRTRVHRALARLRARLAGLRALCPPLFGKLGAQGAAVGLAPVLVAALMVVGGALHPMATATATATAPAAMPARSAPRPVAVQSAGPTAGTEPAVVKALPARVRGPRKAPTPVVVPALPAPAAADDRAPEPIAGDILHPDGVFIFVEPERIVRPSMVEAPRDLLARIDEMIAECL